VTDTWSPAQYDRFQQEREQPAFDLLDMLRPSPGGRAVDLGCGTGRLTRSLHERTRAAETIGLDRSPNMLAPATEGQPPAGLRFELGDIETFPGSRGLFDVIFSNAALQWVDDHATLLPRLAGALRPGGQLAFQVPAEHDGPSHTVADELEHEEPFRSALNGWHRFLSVLDPNSYASLLHRLGLERPTVRLIVYPHLLAGPESVVDWMRGTLLAEYKKRMTPEMYGQFELEYAARLLARSDRSRPYFFPFKRILCWGQRA
jgi:trans-aconitate 2-methyltransferase